MQRLSADETMKMIEEAKDSDEKSRNFAENIIKFCKTVLEIDNPTNGDIIMILFPDVHYVLASQGTPRVVTNLGASFDLDWWNSSYK